jgi:hypothetical protein
LAAGNREVDVGKSCGIWLALGGSTDATEAYGQKQ